MQCLSIGKMSQKYNKIARTLEYLIHKHFLQNDDPNASLSRENLLTAGSTVITAKGLVGVNG